MSPRAFISRLLTKRIENQSLASARQADSSKLHSERHSWRYYLLQFFIVTALMLSAIWLLMAIWYQFGSSSTVTWLTTTGVIGLLTALLTARYLPERVLSKYALSKPIPKSFNNIWAKTKLSKWLTGLYIGVWLIGLGWFMSIAPQQLRDWKPEVSKVLSYTRDSNNSDLVTFNNVRNFDWQTGDEATERWETRTIDMSKLSGIDVINSYWMGPLIAHTLVSFRFEDDRPLSFSLEIRKEKDESFSALGGFFKRFELSLIASEERDIIYTRSNARGEQVYLFPVSHLQQREVKSLFESYLTVADELKAKPAWYNTLTSNCTNIIFYMARVVSGERLPWDYRIWVSGWLPNYLYDLGMLDDNPQKGHQSPTNKTQSWSMDTWYERAHINPKVKDFNNEDHIHGSEFSMQIRQGIPIPPLADRHAIRVNPQ